MATKMRKWVAILASTALISQSLTGCAAYYADEVKAPTEQELEDIKTGKTMKPRSRLREGTFHMQRVHDGVSVVVRDRIKLKKPDLPPFDVAYIGRDIESVVLELANAAGESVIIPNGLRGRQITLVHSGADFPTMLDLVLSKAGYHYNYVDGIWYITRYPIRNYVLELSQSTRRGGLIANTELSAENAQTVSGGSDITTDYSDQIWTQINTTLQELVKVGVVAAGGGGGETNAAGILRENTGTAAQGSQPLVGSTSTQTAAAGASDILPPPTVNGVDTDEAVVTTLTSDVGVQTLQLDAGGGGGRGPEENASPWYQITESAGMITVRAAPEAHRQIETYLQEVQDSALRQVVIEARIVALIREKDTSRGTQSTLQLAKDGLLAGTLGFTPSAQIDSSTVTGGFAYFNEGGTGDLTTIIQSLSELGDVYTISSPTVLARNNQLSRVSVTRQLGYVETEVETATGTTGEVTIGSRTDRARSKNAGTVMSVMPFIGKNGVQMRFRLSVATKSSDTSVLTSIGDNTPVQNLVPNLANNVIDQDMVLQFGRIYAIGGLIESSTTIDETYEPILSQIPGMQEVFRRAKNDRLDTEFIVLLRVSRG